MVPIGKNFLYILFYWSARPSVVIRSLLCMCMRAVSLSCVRLFAAPWTVAHQAPLSVGFSRQEYWSGFPFPSPGDLPGPGMEPGVLQIVYQLSYQGIPRVLKSWSQCVFTDANHSVSSPEQTIPSIPVSQSCKTQAAKGFPCFCQNWLHKSTNCA